MKRSTGRAIYDGAVVIDGLNVSNWDSPAVFESLQAGGVTAINATCAVWEGYRQAMDNIAAWLQRFDQYGAAITHVKTADDILRAKKAGKVGIILGWQNASPIGNDLARLALFHSLGVRIVQLTYNERNLLGNGCYERTDGGLSGFGVDAVHEMNRLGILIDLSHVGDRTTLEAIELSRDPVACTHANARSLVDHPRNKQDAVLRRIADRGGVIGANGFPAFLPGGFESRLVDYLDAVDSLVELVGVDHVGIGTDYTQDQPKAFFDWLHTQQGTKPREWPVTYPDPVVHPQGMETPQQLPNLAGALLERGYGGDDVTKILGGNWLRLFRQVWRT